MERATGDIAPLEVGERALAEGRFEDARRSFRSALAQREAPEAYEGLGWAAIWSEEEAAEGVDAFEHAHRLYLAADDRRGAGRVAIWLAYSYGSLRGQPAVAGGWGERAMRLLEGLAPGPEHVWLLAGGLATMALGRADTGEVRRLGRQAAEMARELGRPDLEAMGIALEGRALVIEGDMTDGMRLLDEAAATSIASGTSEFNSVGLTCCMMLAACELTGDVERATEWCERTSEYAEGHGFRALFAVCRTSYARVLIWRGRWREAEAELQRADRELAAVRPAARGQATAHLAELRRRQGRLDEAADLFAEVDGTRGALLGGAALALDRGDPERACDLVERYLRQTPPSDRAERAVALELAVRAGVECAEPHAVDKAIEELGAIAAAAPTEPLRALASSATGVAAAAAGDPDGARTSFEDAIDLFSRCGARFEAARARLDLARALRDCGRGDAASHEARDARDAFAQLDAVRWRDLADGVLATLVEPTGADTTARPPHRDAPAAARAADAAADLTPRELEVLALLANGLSNRDIATTLVISEHTVHRHVSNLYRKLDVSSRTAAAAYAHRRGLV
ncbi:MAG: response regulator transcription factor [Thermoleophilaceae bacterium]